MFLNNKNVVQALLDFVPSHPVIIVYDTETTGFSESIDRIIQISARRCIVLENGISEIDSMNWYIKPSMSVPDKIVELTGITNEFLADKPSEEEVIEEIVDYFDTVPVCGYYNDRFDNKMMAALFERNGFAFTPEDSVDLYKVVKEVIRPGETINHKLATVSDYFGFTDLIEQFHNAESDSYATYLCFNRLLDMCKNKKKNADRHLIKCNISSVKRYENPRNWRVKRLYIDTDKGDFYYDLIKKRLEVKDRNDRLGRYDTEDLMNKVFSFCHVDSEDGLKKYGLSTQSLSR